MARLLSPSPRLALIVLTLAVLSPSCHSLVASSAQAVANGSSRSIVLKWDSVASRRRQLAAGQYCSTLDKRQFQDFFSNVVLIVHIKETWVAQVTARFWKDIYSTYFPKMVILSEEAIPELAVEARAWGQWAKDPALAYFALADIMKAHPEAEGFLWTSDAVALNYWNLLTADKSRFWMVNGERHFESRWFPFSAKQQSEWADWGSAEKWRKAMTAAFMALDEDSKRNFSEHIKPRTEVYPKRPMDLFYIPQRHSAAISAFIPMFLQSGAAVELALPFMFYMLDAPTEFDHVLDEMVYRWDTWWGLGEQYHPRWVWTPFIPGLEPWSVVEESEKRALYQALRIGDPCLDVPEWAQSADEDLGVAGTIMSLDGAPLETKKKKKKKDGGEESKEADLFPRVNNRQPAVHHFPSIGFISYSAFRLSPSRFVVLGLGLSRDTMMRRVQREAESMKSQKRSLACNWLDHSDPTQWIPGSLTFQVSKERFRKPYQAVLLFCDLEQATVGHGVSAGHGEESGAIALLHKTGGYLQVQLGFHGYVPYMDSAEDQVKDYYSQGPFEHELVFCGPPIAWALEPKAVTQWMDYHLFGPGIGHFFLYDAGGVDGELADALERFKAAGVLTVMNLTGFLDFDSHHHGESLAHHDCLFRNRDTAAWVAFVDLDEYMEELFKGESTLRNVLQWAREQTPPLAWLSRGSIDYEVSCDEDSSEFWKPRGGRYAVEVLRTRHKNPMCYTEHEMCWQMDTSLCLGFCGWRKIMANPRLVEVVQTFSVQKVWQGQDRMGPKGMDLSATEQLRNAHFRGLTRKQGSCKMPLNSDYLTDNFNSSAVARVAAKARACAKKKGVPQWACK